MPLNMAREMAKSFHELAVWLEQEADDLESCISCRLRNGEDESALVAAELRHRARNLEAIVRAFHRLDAGNKDASENNPALTESMVAIEQVSLGGGHFQATRSPPSMP